MLYILFIIIILFYNLTFLLTECFKNNNLQLLTKNELLNILINNTDNYYNRFTQLDLKVRNVNTVDEYKKNIINIFYDCNSYEYNQIIDAVNKVDNVLKKYNIIGFDGYKASQIKWKIGVINSNIYENGLPHTRSDVIIIPKNILYNNKLKTVLLHEKIHIYQKIYSNDITQYLINNNFTKSRKKIKNIRANPDIDEYIYKNINGQEMMCIYNENPSSILDVLYIPNNNSENEHPFEYMAYTIEKKLNIFF